MKRKTPLFLFVFLAILLLPAFFVSSASAAAADDGDGFAGRVEIISDREFKDKDDGHLVMDGDTWWIWHDVPVRVTYEKGNKTFFEGRLGRYEQGPDGAPFDTVDGAHLVVVADGVTLADATVHEGSIPNQLRYEAGVVIMEGFLQGVIGSVCAIGLAVSWYWKREWEI